MERKKNNYVISMQQHYGDKIIDLDFYLKYIEDNFNYIYVIHNKETDLHFHAILIDVVLTWKELLELFPSADIDLQKKSNLANYKYLLHKDKKSIELGKVPYSPTDIHFNIDLNSYLKPLDDFDSYFEDILQKIYLGCFNSITDLIANIEKKYRFKILKQYFILKDLIDDINSQYRINLCNFEEVENETKT